MHLAHVPWFIRRRPGYFQALFDTVSVFGVHVIYPNRHPRTLVCGIVAFRPEGHLDVGPAASALAVLAQEDLAFAGPDAAERRRITPVPALCSPEFLEPREAFDDVGHVEDRSHSLGLHSAILPT
jgi:hypothetical protein